MFNSVNKGDGDWFNRHSNGFGDDRHRQLGPWRLVLQRQHRLVRLFNSGNNGVGDFFNRHNKHCGDSFSSGNKGDGDWFSRHNQGFGDAQHRQQGDDDGLYNIDSKDRGDSCDPCLT